MFRLSNHKSFAKLVRGAMATTVLFGTLLSQGGVISAAGNKEDLSKEPQISCSVSAQEADAFTKVDDNTTMWIEGGHIYKIETSKPNKTLSYSASTGHSIAEGSVNAKISERQLSLAEMGQSPKAVISKQIAYDKKTKNQSGVLSLEMSNQAWDGSYTIKSTLKVSYDSYNDGDTLYIYSGSGSYTRAARNGVSVKSAKLYYSATGSIYKNGKFVKNGTKSNSFSSTGTFSNKTLMGKSYCIKSPTIGGVGYSISATRGVSVLVTCTLV